MVLHVDAAEWAVATSNSFAPNAMFLSLQAEALNESLVHNICRWQAVKAGRGSGMISDSFRD